MDIYLPNTNKSIVKGTKCIGLTLNTTENVESSLTNQTTVTVPIIQANHDSANHLPIPNKTTSDREQNKLLVNPNANGASPHIYIVPKGSDEFDERIFSNL